MYLKLDKILQSQGFGSRKYCQNLIQSGKVTINNEVITDIKSKFLVENFEFSIFSQQFTYREKVYIALYKPKHYECSHQPLNHVSVFQLLPDYLIQRNIQTVGRLDQDTTGLLLLTDDGQFLHRLTHPKKHVAKYYVVDTLNPVSVQQIQQLQQGVTLKNEKGIFKAFDIQQLQPKQIRFAIDQGVFHQVKRMLHAVGNDVVELHRDQIAQLSLPQLDLLQSEWRYLSAEECALLTI